MYITILGSCRQDSLYAYYKITPIRDFLTYPHYSKEILQAAQFCKGELSISPEHTQYLFRSGILTKQSLFPAMFRTDFETTDLFVVEIASRLFYKYGDFYAHHIITEPQYGFQDISNVVQGQLTDSEIEEDLVQLKQVLHPKPFCIVTHICTRTHGSRYELVQLLKRLCKKHRIYLFDPVAELTGYDPDVLYEKEAVLSHYTKEGHAIIGAKYNEFIQRIRGEHRQFVSLT
jgi:hypothetical protein